VKLTTDAEMTALNQQFRNLEQPTDVLSFATLETDFPQIDELLAE